MDEQIRKALASEAKKIAEFFARVDARKVREDAAREAKRKQRKAGEA